jgi:uncharacterized protein (DUF2235 family)
LWTSQPAPGQTLEQIWFTGAHSDVGGGYGPDPGTQTALSDITLSWMMTKAWALGLETYPAFNAQYSSLAAENSLDALHQSWNVLWGFPRPRSIADHASNADSASVANSVVIRCQNEPAYRPCNLRFIDGVLSPEYAIVPVVLPAQAAQAASG